MPHTRENYIITVHYWGLALIKRLFWYVSLITLGQKRWKNWTIIIIIIIIINIVIIIIIVLHTLKQIWNFTTPLTQSSYKYTMGLVKSPHCLMP